MTEAQEARLAELVNALLAEGVDGDDILQTTEFILADPHATK